MQQQAEDDPRRQQQGAQVLPPAAAALLQALPHAAWICDGAGRVLAANAALCRVAGCDAAAAAGQPWKRLLLPPCPAADADAVQQLEAAAAVGQPAQAHLLCQSSGGSFWGHLSVAPLPPAAAGTPAPAAAPPPLLCTLLGAPAAAAAPPPVAGVPPQLAQLCNQALASTSESVAIMDPRRPASGPGNVIVWVNRAFERLTGYPAARALGRAHSFLQGPDTDLVVLAEIEEALGEGRPVSAELLVYRADGSPFWSQARGGAGLLGRAAGLLARRGSRLRPSAVEPRSALGVPCVLPPLAPAHPRRCPAPPLECPPSRCPSPPSATPLAAWPTGWRCSATCRGARRRRPRCRCASRRSGARRRRCGLPVAAGWRRAAAAGSWRAVWPPRLGSWQQQGR